MSNHSPPSIPWFGVLLAALALAGCETATFDAPDSHDGGGSAPLTCARPAPGCACEPNDGPIRCVPPRQGSSTCLVGDMYCRGGEWSGCESLRAFEDTQQQAVGGSTAALIGAPTACDSCNPECAQVVDAPTCAEITARDRKSVV